MAVVLPLAVVAAPSGAHADDDPTCGRLRAEARSEAILLYAPSLSLEGARIPGVIDPADATAAPADGWQARAALAWSPVDLLRGRALERVAAAACASDVRARGLDRILAVGTRYGELAANRAELAYLEAHLPAVDVLVGEALDAFARQRTTVLEVDELRGRRTTLRRRATDLRHAQIVLEALDGDVAPGADLEALATRARAAALDVDRRRAEVRALSAWRFDVRAGVAAAEHVDYFAVIALGYSLGERFQRRADRRAVAARAAELTTDERSVTVRAARLRRALADSLPILTAELTALDDELATLAAETTRLDGLDSDAARHLRARATLARLELESRRVSIAALAATRRTLIGRVP